MTLEAICARDVKAGDSILLLERSTHVEFSGVVAETRVCDEGQGIWLDSDEGGTYDPDSLVLRRSA